MGDSRHKYKSLEVEAKDRKSFYEDQAERAAEEATHYTPPYRRKFKGIDDYHRRAENTAFRTGDNFHEASKARGEHNINYMGHFKSRWDFDLHECAAETDEVNSERWHAVENAHRDLRAVSRTPVFVGEIFHTEPFRKQPDPPRRRSKFEREMRSMLDEAYPEEP